MYACLPKCIWLCQSILDGLRLSFPPIFAYVLVCVLVCMGIHVCVSAQMHLAVPEYSGRITPVFPSYCCVCGCMCGCMCVYMCAYVRVCVLVCGFVCVRICVYVCLYVLYVCLWLRQKCACPSASGCAS